MRIFRKVSCHIWNIQINAFVLWQRWEWILHLLFPVFLFRLIVVHASHKGGKPPLPPLFCLPSSVTLSLGRSCPERATHFAPLHKGLSAILTRPSLAFCKGFSAFFDTYRATSRTTSRCVFRGVFRGIFVLLSNTFSNTGL